MTSFKYILIVLSSVGLLFLAACGNGQQSSPSSSGSAESPSASMSEAGGSGMAQGKQKLEPATQTGDARITLGKSDPLKQGKNTFMLTVVDPAGQPLDVKNVQAQMVMTAKEMDAMGMKGMGEGSAKTQVKSAASPGTYDIETTIPFAGNWQLKVDLKEAKPPASAVFNLAVK
jgi:hypothetical protein